MSRGWKGNYDNEFKGELIIIINNTIFFNSLPLNVHENSPAVLKSGKFWSWRNKTVNPALQGLNRVRSSSAAGLCNETPKSKHLSWDLPCGLPRGNKLGEQIGTANPGVTPRKPRFAAAGSQWIAGSKRSRDSCSFPTRLSSSHLFPYTLRLMKLPPTLLLPRLVGR